MPPPAAYEAFSPAATTSSTASEPGSTSQLPQRARTETTTLREGQHLPFADDLHPGMAAAYKASGRTQRIFDTVVHHPYGDNNAERPYEMHPGPYFIGEGDWNKLVATYPAGLRRHASGGPRPLPARSSPCVRSGTSGRVPDPASAEIDHLLRRGECPDGPDVSSGERESPRRSRRARSRQATQLRWALRLAYCQPYVEAVFNFLIRDDRTSSGTNPACSGPTGSRRARTPPWRRGEPTCRERRVVRGPERSRPWTRRCNQGRR